MSATPRVVLVTGAAKRLGLAIARDFAARGYAVAIHYHQSAAEAKAVVADLTATGTAAAAFKADLGDPEQVESLLAAVLAHFGRLDVLIACAAVFRKTPWTGVTLADWDFHLRGNLSATFYLARAAAPRLADDGVIITFGDWSGLRPYQDYLPYCVSKAAVIALSQALAQELAPRLRVNCVCPGTILPPEHADPAAQQRIIQQTPLRRIGQPRDIVAAVRFLTDETSFATGTVLVVDGGRLIANAQLY
jgi:pteridine reductase